MIYAFSTYVFDDGALELSREGRRVALEPQPARLLAALLARPGEVVTRDDLRQALWGDDTHVDYDRGLAYCVGQVRAALGDAADTPRFVQTLPKRGFRFIAPVSVQVATPVARERTPVALDATPLAVTSRGSELTAPTRGASRRHWPWLAAAAVLVAAVVGWTARAQPHPIVAVSIFDNETGDSRYDAFVAGISDLVVTRLTAVAPGRLGIVGNLAPLRQPRNIRNLRQLAETLPADYIVLGQLQRQGDDLRFIVHLVRLSDGVHLWAQRLIRPVDAAQTFEAAVVAEAEQAVRSFVLAAGGA